MAGYCLKTFNTGKCTAYYKWNKSARNKGSGTKSYMRNTYTYLQKFPCLDVDIVAVMVKHLAFNM